MSAPNHPSHLWIALPNCGLRMRQLGHNRTAPRRCANTVDPRGLADYQGVD